MDLSGLKWPMIILLVVGIGWLLSSGGTNYMFNNFTKAEVGADPARDKTDEGGLSRLGGFMMKTLRYEKAEEIFSVAMDRYPSGANFWYNQYRLVTCKEKLEKYREAADLLEGLIQANANAIDSRVPETGNLRLRADKLIEVHELR
jgi:tetratricopeptide (TPR) repeat protein